jgi:hypothetical protein
MFGFLILIIFGQPRLSAATSGCYCEALAEQVAKRGANEDRGGRFQFPISGRKSLTLLLGG